jgi:hypothetical protein
MTLKTATRSLRGFKSTDPRKIEFIGDTTDDSIVIGNYGDARLVAKGKFNLSGIIYSKNTVEINLDGDGTVSFRGFCKRLVIKGITGNCVIDLTGMTSKIVWCESIRSNAVVNLGTMKIIELISLDDEAVVKYEGKPILLNYSLRGNSRIEGWRNS